MEQTYLMVKPDGVQRRLVGEIIRRFEAKGLTLAELKMLTPARGLAEAHYGVHRGKPFFPKRCRLYQFRPGGGHGLGRRECRPIIPQVDWRNQARRCQPRHDPGDYANTIEQNLIHGSDSPENAAEKSSCGWVNCSVAYLRPSVRSLWLRHTHKNLAVRPPPTGPMPIRIS